MANRTFHNRQYTTQADVVTVYLKITGAADVAADGYTINSGTAHVASVARSDEGQITVTMTDTYNGFLGIQNLGCSIADTDLQFVSETVASTKTIIFKTITGASAADPDAGVLYLGLVLRNSSATS